LLEALRKLGREGKLAKSSKKLSSAKFAVKRKNVRKKSLCRNKMKTLPVVEKNIYILPHTLKCQNSVTRFKHDAYVLNHFFRHTITINKILELR
jgi:hypothetical protein